MEKYLLDSTLTYNDSPFTSLLDPRVLRALADLSFTHPTLVQAQAIPLILQGKDVLAKARTGSGKTAAYGVPAVQKILQAKQQGSSDQGGKIRVLVLVPTRELATQVAGFIKNATKYCEGIVSCLNVAGGSTASQTGGLSLHDIPDILISTPSKCLSLLQSKVISLSDLSLLIIDEADLILSYGHSSDLQSMLEPSQNWIPRVGVQGVLMSATMTGDVQALKGWALRNPAILTLSEPTSSLLLSQYYTLTSETDKFLLLYVLLKLKLIKGKALIFVNTVERGYKVRLFLEQFGIKACVLNAELPLNSRYHIVEEFNKGIYDYIIATDEADAGQPDEGENHHQAESSASASTSSNLISTSMPAADEQEEVGTNGAHEDEAEEEEDGEAQEKPAESSRKAQKRKATDQPTSSKPKANKKGRKEDKSYGVSRGIDFVAVACVINFDLPSTTRSYTHRVGRTARAGQSGLALSFVVEKKYWGKDRSVTLETAEHDQKVFQKIRDDIQEDMGSDIKEWDFGGRRKEIEGFRYRMEDALKAVTGKRVQEARREELRRELLNSDKLKAHFAANPLDFSYLRHDTPLHPTRVQPHMKHVPSYLMPRIANVPITQEGEGAGHIPFHKPGGRGRSRGGHRGGRGGGSGRGKKANPLKHF